MSNRTRTLFQKDRRKYLAKCKKDGSKPMDVDSFYKKWHKQMQKKSNASVEQPKPQAQKKPAAKPLHTVKAKAPAVHKIRKGDTVEFVDFTPSRFALFAVKAIILAYSSLIENSHSADKKCVKCKACKKAGNKPSKR